MKFLKKAVLVVMGLFASGMALANTGGSSVADLTSIGATIATAIMGFVAIVSAIGIAAVSVLVMIQGFKMAFSFMRSIK